MVQAAAVEAVFQRQYSLLCSSIISLRFFWATLATAMMMSFVLRQFSSTLFARKSAVAAMF